jgi:alpha-ketoglutarate-dependent taurine dioxygenase
MSTLNDINSLKRTLFDDGIAYIPKCDLSKEKLLDFSKSLSIEKENKLLEWDFGPVMQMHFNRSAENYLFSDEEVPFHWDGAFHKEPKYLVFYCTDTLSESGGESLFCDTRKVFSSLSSEKKQLARNVKIRYSTEKKAHYGGTVDVQVLQCHPENQKNILRFAEPVSSDLNPVTREIVSGDIALCKELDSLIYNKDFIYEHKWRKGDLLIVDNFSYIHGRRSLGKNTSRSFLRVQVM